MLRQKSQARTLWGLGAATAALLVLVGLGAPKGKAAQVPECVQLSRLVASHQHSLLDGARFRQTQQHAYRICAADPAAFRRLIRVS